MPFTHTLLAAFAIVALLVGTATSENDTCFNKTKKSDWNIYASGLNATGCNFSSDVNLFVKSMVENAKKESLDKVVADITGSAIVELQIDASSSGIDLTIPLILTVSKNTITKRIAIFGKIPHGSDLTFSGNTIETTEMKVVYDYNTLVLSESSTLTFKENTITQMLGTAFGGGRIVSLEKLTLESGSSFVCTGNTVDMMRSTDSYGKMYALYLTDASVSNSSISVSDNTINWKNNGSTPSKIVIMQFMGSNKKFFGNNISIKDNTMTTAGNTSFERFWDVNEMKDYADIALDACGNSLNGATLYDLGQRYLNPVSLADLLVSDCPNPNKKNNDTNGKSGNDTSSIATTSTVVAGALTYLFVYFLF